jgi:hypothetical protein
MVFFFYFSKHDIIFVAQSGCPIVVPVLLLVALRRNSVPSFSPQTWRLPGYL